MNRILRILNIEDSKPDVMLLQHHLSQAGYALLIERVETAATMRSALESREWDVILCDYSMPQFNALQALALLKEMELDIPFIVISGTVGEAVAVKAMRAGAHNYLMKDNLLRLVPTIERELQEVANRKARRQAEEALKNSEERFRALTEKTSDLTAIVDVKATVQYINPSIERLLGYTTEEWLGRQIFEFIHPDDTRAAIEALEMGIQDQEERLPFELRVRHKKGHWRVFEARDTNLLDNKAVAGIVINARDITERKQAEEKIRQSQEQLTESQRLTHIGNWKWNLQDNTLIWSDEHFHIFGLRPGEIDPGYESLVAQYIHPDDRDLVRSTVEKSLSTLEPFNFHYRVIQPDGSEHIIHSLGNIVCDEQGNLVRAFGTAQDVTVFKQTEESLKRLNAELESQRQRLDNIIANVPGIVWESSGSSYIPTQSPDFVSNYVETMLGYSVQEWLSIPDFWLTIIHSEDKEKTARQAAEAFASGECVRLEFRWLSKEGQIVWVESHSAVIFNDEGQPVGVRGVTIDITERKTLEEQLRQSQKLEAIGMLASGIAHDFNNLLTAIIGYSDLSLFKLRKEDPLHRNITEVKKAADRAADLTRQLLAFSRKQVMQMKIIDLNFIISELEKILRRVIGEDIELRVTLEKDLGKVKADLGQIEQVLMNLVVNARDAMPQGGKLTIETQNVYLDEEYARQHINVTPGNYVMLAVSDTGIGIDEKIRARIFEPFFTTKGTGQGTGLGLSTVYGIVKQSGGNIWVYSEVGQGTTFKVYLPRIEEGAQEHKPASAVDESWSGTETILVAEDEDIVRKLTVQVLESYGYYVLEAADGGAAILIFERYKEPIHLLLTDVVMPEMSGGLLSDRLSQLRPEMKILFMSGYTNNAIAHQGILVDGANLIQKPFTPKSLAQKVREVIDSP